MRTQTNRTRYTITFAKDGFERLVRGSITLDVGFTTVNGQLQVGASTQEVTVTADVALLQTETASRAPRSKRSPMAQLPQVKQDWENFTILLPGATGTPGGSQGSSNPGQEVAVNGNLPYNNILADSASDTLLHSMNANPATFENVSELQVNTSSFSAQYGIGGIIFNQAEPASSTERFTILPERRPDGSFLLSDRTDSVSAIQQFRWRHWWVGFEEEDVFLFQL